MDFQRVLHLVRRGTHHHLRQVAQRAHAREVEFHLAKRRGETPGFRQRQTAHVDAMGGAQQHHAADAVARAGDERIRTRGHRARIDITGVRHDQRLDVRRTRRGARRGQHVVDHAAQYGRRIGIEHAGDGGGTNGIHGPHLLRRRTGLCEQRRPARCGSPPKSYLLKWRIFSGFQVHHAVRERQTTKRRALPAVLSSAQNTEAPQAACAYCAFTLRAASTSSGAYALPDHSIS